MSKYVVDFDTEWKPLPGFKPQMASAKAQEHLSRCTVAEVWQVAREIAHKGKLGGRELR